MLLRIHNQATRLQPYSLKTESSWVHRMILELGKIPATELVGKACGAATDFEAGL